QTAPSGSLNVEIGGSNPTSQYDQWDVTGTITLAGQLNITVTNSFVPTVGQTFTLIRNSSPNLINGTFTNLPEGSIINVGGNQFQITYHGGTDNDVVLTMMAYVVTNT